MQNSVITHNFACQNSKFVNQLLISQFLISFIQIQRAFRKPVFGSHISTVSSENYALLNFAKKHIFTCKIFIGDGRGDHSRCDPVKTLILLQLLVDIMRSVQQIHMNDDEMKDLFG